MFQSQNTNFKYSYSGTQQSRDQAIVSYIETKLNPFQAFRFIEAETKNSVFYCSDTTWRLYWIFPFKKAKTILQVRVCVEKSLDLMTQQYTQTFLHELDSY